MPSSELSRRDFVRVGLGLGFGFATGAALLPVSRGLNESVTHLTGHPTGNAILMERDQNCQRNPTQLDCVLTANQSGSDRASDLLASAMVEENGVRVGPALITSRLDNRESPLRDVLTGTGGVTLTRREVLVGVASSVVFGFLHNLTPRGLNTEVIPASQIAHGAVYWYLQRKFGMVSNISAHTFFNYLASAKK